MTPQELIERRRFIGASESAAACGLSSWTTPFALWQAKRGDGPVDVDNEAMQWGRRLELPILQRYAEDAEEPVQYPCAPVVHPEFAFMRATPDGLTPTKLVEVKTARSGYEWGEGNDAVPLAYLLQVTHGMLCTGRRLADIPVLIGGSDYRVYHITLDDELASLLIERERAFWQHVEDGTPPDVRSIADAVSRWPKDKGTTVMATQEVADAVVKLLEIEQQQEALEADHDALGLAVRTCMADASVLTDGSGRTLATWKAQVRSQLDFKGLKAAHPDIYEKFTLKSPSRVFRLNRNQKT